MPKSPMLVKKSYIYFTIPTERKACRSHKEEKDRALVVDQQRERKERVVTQKTKAGAKALH